MEKSHPIEGLMQAAMSNIESMVDVNTIIGEPIQAGNCIIIPISKVSFGFAAGGSEFNEETIEEYTKRDKDDEEIKYKLPFGGGTGAGVNITPVAFIIVQEENVKLLPVNHSSIADRLIDFIPDLIDKIYNKSGNKSNIKEEIDDIINNKRENNSKIKKEEYEVEYQEDLDD